MVLNRFKIHYVHADCQNGISAISKKELIGGGILN